VDQHDVEVAVRRQLARPYPPTATSASPVVLAPRAPVERAAQSASASAVAGPALGLAHGGRAQSAASSGRRCAPARRVDRLDPDLAVADLAGARGPTMRGHDLVDLGSSTTISMRIFGTSAMSYSAPR
jgi:hypothetical protein